LVQPLQRIHRKGADRYLLTSYERDVICPHALEIEDLLSRLRKVCDAVLFGELAGVGPNSDVANGVRNANRRAQDTVRCCKQGKGRRTA